MALIGTIRKNMWMVIILLAVALAGFIIMDMTSASSRGSFGSRTTIGEVNGNKIDYMDFQRTEEALYGNSGDVYNRRASLWNYFVENSLLNEIADANGLAVGGDELHELEFGSNLSPLIQSFFRDPQTGQVDRNQLNEVKTAIEDGTVTNPEFAYRFNELRKQVIKTQKEAKLNNLVAKSMYTPTWYAETMEKLNNEKASFEYVKIPFESVADSDISLTDEDYAAYIKDNAAKYTNKEEVRNLIYWVKNVAPSHEDSTAILEKMVQAAESFKTAVNDSLFVAGNNGVMDPFYNKADMFPETIKENLASMSSGDVYGPYLENGSYNIFKLISKRIEADSAKASHILRTVSNDNPMELIAANAYIDSIKTAIQSGSVSFADAATAGSQDPGSASNGGELGTFTPGTMVPEFNDAVFTGKDGGLYVVKTQFGVHLIKVEKLIYKNSDMKYKLAYISEPIIPSEATQQRIEDEMLEKLDGIKTIDDLNKVAASGGKVEYSGGLKANDFTFGDLGSSQTTRDMVKWAFEKDTKVGQVSPTLYTINDETHYVAKEQIVIALKSIDKPGLASVEAVKNLIEPAVKNLKKGEKIKSRISGSDLSNIAQSFDTLIETVNDQTFGSPSLPDGSQEPVVIGKIFAASSGATTAPIVGNSGVYVAKITNKTAGESEPGGFSQKMQLTQNSRMQAMFGFMSTLRKSAKISDNRNTFY
ncbi:MAG: peptidylprolyl isomerase [Chitinophagales bacterium]|nr:peptidylprolyl isomerase [Chitinophagales bacterium]